MLWEVEISPKGQENPGLARVEAEYALLGLPKLADGPVILDALRGFLLEGELNSDDVNQLTAELLVDPVVEEAVINPIPSEPDLNISAGALHWTVLLRPGVMDPAAESVLAAARDLGIKLESVRTFRRFVFDMEGPPPGVENELRKMLANDAIEQIIVGEMQLDHLSLGQPYQLRVNTVLLRSLDDRGLEKLSKQGQLALNLSEMRVIQVHYRDLDRDPTDVELETLAQTWSEHCSHKTLKGKIDFNGRRYNNLLKETIFGATQEIRKKLGADDWCVSVFEDNAGVVRFDDENNVCFKVETHNHPSAIEPYGGANTGIGGVIRDPLGTGLGARPICNTDVFCFAPPDTAPAE
jgi:phosphoribosylformylglycinamidine (FGAM) synthase PurS component